MREVEVEVGKEREGLDSSKPKAVVPGFKGTAPRHQASYKPMSHPNTMTTLKL